MSKKTLSILFLVAAVTIAIIGGAYFMGAGKKEEIVSTPTIQPNPTPTEELTTWIDQAEFSFMYPKNLKLNPHEEDIQNYSHVELTSPEHNGSLIVWTKDTNAVGIDDWVKKEKITGAIDSELGNESAKKIIGNNQPKKITISTIYGGYLYQIDVTLEDQDYWSKVFDTVSSTFKFINTPKSDSTNNNSFSQNQSENNAPQNESIEEEIIE
ncbi:hypothetical protein A2960_00115 [Candidatus Gottesmanbacteria bacterium RIFCSPLOWO2_01_FULL_39_12b]|uniref:Uncharacterized protein n=1 Tax=Candidatus Gottesmanbacteria bacterium RIFCSPLOWO2_01_FULL_39_12b TaxID=1798388 RepID=A0A1F6ARN6_9BACT|nr:MAG: hypothetical protein A2960_00115 [Candidatus Gottesmanbacteria bacterium RIFCSPLOWO2_01_FULL_39_12b]